MKDYIPTFCPKCGGIWAPESSTTSSGFSFGKAAAGALLFGSVGAVAGINGKKNHIFTYKCKKCGYSHVYQV